MPSERKDYLLYVSNLFPINFGVRQGSVLCPSLFAIYLDNLARSSLLTRGMYVILYADYILLITPSICTLEKLLRICERELNLLDMVINVRKSCCVRIGPRNSTCCCSINIVNGPVIPWTDELRYLGVFIMPSRIFKCSLIHVKKINLQIS